MKMGAQTGLLAALAALLCINTPVNGAKGCNGFRHLENGQTFFRYGGLLVIFRCYPGYKLHGYKTNSCVSGQWSRDTPVCVGSGCPDLGPLNHGTSSINEDGSWVEFSCNSGFRLHGPAMLYCKGHTWNSTKPVCKESDMMNSVSVVSVQKSGTQQRLQAAVTLNTQTQSNYDTVTNSASKDADLKFGLLSHTPSQMSNSESVNPKVDNGFKVKTNHLEAQEANEAEGPETGTGRDEAAEQVDKVTEVFGPKSHPSTTVPATLSLVSGTERSTSPPPSLSTARTPAITAVTFAPTFHLRHLTSALPVLGTEGALQPVTSQDDVTLSGPWQTVSAATGVKFSPPSSQPGSVDKEELKETSTENSLHFTNSSPTSSPASAALPPAPPPPSTSSTTESRMRTRLPNVTLPSTTSEPTSHWTLRDNLTMHATSDPPLLPPSPSRRPVCPHPPVPAHGTFSFHNVENPGPREYRHYIQYACYPGYTLAHGDIQCFCQQGGTWSGVTPVCLELTPCSSGNGGCSQLCAHSQHYNQSSNQTQTRAQCHCKPGFTLLDDGRACRDLDECEEGQHQCQQRCVNTFGSFMCSCDDGYQPAHDQTSCTDVDECLLPAAVTGCVFGCVNTPGSFHCQCPAGYSLQSADRHCQDIDECADNQGLGPCMEQCHNSPGSYRCSCTYGHVLAGDGRSCIAECPSGYRKQPTTTPPESSTAPALREECVDINECQPGMCEGQCVNLPGSHRCICPRGYTLHKDGRRCKDINECTRKNGGCSHLCVNQKGGHKCACPPSHRLSSYSWKKCLPRTTANTAG